MTVSPSWMHPALPPQHSHNRGPTTGTLHANRLRGIHSKCRNSHQQKTNLGRIQKNCGWPNISCRAIDDDVHADFTKNAPVISWCAGKMTYTNWPCIIVQLKRESYQPQLLQDFSQYKVGGRMMDVWYIYRTLKNSKVAVNFTLNLKPLKPAIRFCPRKMLPFLWFPGYRTHRIHGTINMFTYIYHKKIDPSCIDKYASVPYIYIHGYHGIGCKKNATSVVPTCPGGARSSAPRGGHDWQRNWSSNGFEGKKS